MRLRQEQKWCWMVHYMQSQCTEGGVKWTKVSGSFLAKYQVQSHPRMERQQGERERKKKYEVKSGTQKRKTSLMRYQSGMCRPGPLKPWFRRSPSEPAVLGRHNYNTSGSVVHWPSPGSDTIFQSTRPGLKSLLSWGPFSSSLALCSFS